MGFNLVLNNGVNHLRQGTSADYKVAGLVPSREQLMKYSMQTKQVDNASSGINIDGR